MIRIYHIPTRCVVTNGAILEVDDLAVRTPKLEEFLIVADHPVKAGADSEVVLRHIDADGNIETAFISEVKYHGDTFSILFTAEAAGTVSMPIFVRSDGASGRDEYLHFTIVQKFVEIDDRLTILLNNYGYQITDEWVKCFRDADINEATPNSILINEKAREFLLEFFTLVGIRGCYRTLFAALNYFGFSDIVYFKEKWLKNGTENEYKEAELRDNTVAQTIFNDGYTKTGSLTLYYDIDILDPDEPYDETGLPNYKRIELDYKELYTKLLLLKKILMQYFIPCDIFISDIIGILRANAPITERVWEQQYTVLNIDMEKKFNFFEITYPELVTGADGRRYGTISEKKLIIETPPLRVNNQAGWVVAKIIKSGDELNALDDYELVGAFWRGDAFIVTPQITFSGAAPEGIRGFKFRICKIVSYTAPQDFEALNYYTSPLLQFTQLHNATRFAVRDIGEYEISIIVFGARGEIEAFSERFFVGLPEIMADFYIGLPRYKNLEQYAPFPRFLEFNTVQETVAGGAHGVLVPRPADSAATWRLDRWFDERIDEPTNIKVLGRDFLNIPVGQIAQTPLSEFWCPCYIFSADVLKPRWKLGLKLFQGHEWSEVTMADAGQFLEDCIELSMYENSPFSFFTYDIQPLAAFDGDGAPLPLKDMFLMEAKLKDFDITQNIYYRILDGDGNIVVSNSSEDAPHAAAPRLTRGTKTSAEPLEYYFSQIYPGWCADPIIRINHIDPEQEGFLRIMVGNTPVFDEELTQFAALRDLAARIKELLEGYEGRVEVSAGEQGDALLESVYIRGIGTAIFISHPALGLRWNCARHGALPTIWRTKCGSDVQPGSIVVLVPDMSIKFDMTDVHWNVYDTFSKILVYTQKSFYGKYIPLTYGIYDIEMILTDKITGAPITVYKQGCITVGITAAGGGDNDGATAANAAPPPPAAMPMLTFNRFMLTDSYGGLFTGGDENVLGSFINNEN